jgi:hypothetical protein
MTQHGRLHIRPSGRGTPKPTVIAAPTKLHIKEESAVRPAHRAQMACHRVLAPLDDRDASVGVVPPEAAVIEALPAAASQFFRPWLPSVSSGRRKKGRRLGVGGSGK